MSGDSWPVVAAVIAVPLGLAVLAALLGLGLARAAGKPAPVPPAGPSAAQLAELIDERHRLWLAHRESLARDLAEVRRREVMLRIRRGRHQRRS